MLRLLFFIFFTTPCFLLSQNNASYGKIKIDKKELKIYSQAYIHYPQVFRDFDRSAQFDTTSFEERFLDTTYANTIKIDPNYREPKSYETLALDFYGEIEGELWFVFKKNEGYASSLMRKNPESNVFTGMAWVYKGDLAKKEFLKKYVFYPRKFFLRRKQRRQWTDFRIYYDNNSQSFAINLKNIHGFQELEAYPRYTSLSRDLKESQERYEKINAKYLKTLNKRKAKFDKALIKRKNTFYKSVNDYDENLWKSFQENYMTEEERKLTRDEWLIYYDKVIANERMAMGNAAPTLNNVTRSMKIDSYLLQINSVFIPLNNDTINTTLKTLYQNKKEEKLAITNVLVIDVEAKTYKEYVGSKGIKTIAIDSPRNINSVMLVWLRNGDVGFLTQEELTNITINKKGEAMISLNVINKKFASVQSIRDELNF